MPPFLTTMSSQIKASIRTFTPREKRFVEDSRKLSKKVGLGGKLACWYTQHAAPEVFLVITCWHIPFPLYRHSSPLSSSSSSSSPETKTSVSLIRRKRLKQPLLDKTGASPPFISGTIPIDRNSQPQASVSVLGNLPVLPTFLSSQPFCLCPSHLQGGILPRQFLKKVNPVDLQWLPASDSTRFSYHMCVVQIWDVLALRHILSGLSLSMPVALNSSAFISTRSEGLSPVGEVAHFFKNHDFYISFQTPPCPVQTLFRISLGTYCPSSVVQQRTKCPLFKAFITSTTSCGVSSCG